MSLGWDQCVDKCDDTNKRFQDLCFLASAIRPTWLAGLCSLWSLSNSADPGSCSIRAFLVPGVTGLVAPTGCCSYITHMTPYCLLARTHPMHLHKPKKTDKCHLGNCTGMYATQAVAGHKNNSNFHESFEVKFILVQKKYEVFLWFFS